MQFLGLITAARWLRIPYWELAKRPVSEVQEISDMMAAIGSVQPEPSSSFMED
jgi:hypothetical protein